MAPYASLVEFKAYAGVTDSSVDALLFDFLNRATRIIDSHCRRRFVAAADSTRRFHALRDVRGLKLRLDQDLASVTSIVNGNGQTVTAAQYVLLPTNAAGDGKPYYAIQLKATAGIAWEWNDDPEEAIAVTGRWAYCVTPPDDIVQACVRLAHYLDKQKNSAGDLDRPVFLGGSTTLLPSRLPRDIEDMLSPYVRPKVRG